MPDIPAFSLPQQPAIAIPLILVVLTLAYALLTVLFKIPPSESGTAGFSAATPEEASSDVEERDAPDAEEPAWETSNEYDNPVESVQPAPMSIETFVLHGRRIATGMRAGDVVSVFSRNDAAALPVIERDDEGRARSVERVYTVDGQRMMFRFERSAGNGILALTAITLAAR